ncbi:hypothetical protein [Neobacillus sp. PS3-40]|uniref:DUF7002 family protein n=1 Tax=Neobacillus sp. PS3-40 TaxID=3070679 RepID=UPI0027E1E69D|nr:hypothetical protein [Neobacillus sp. PS3-40]WML44535.1 hypothetical protein RCG20_01060 [Neobacillus sp. PS3-40]
MKDSIIRNLTKSQLRKSLYHFTRLKNLPSIANFDALFSSHKVEPSLSYRRRETAKIVDYQGYLFIANAHLRIADAVMHPDTTQEEFRSYIDKNVFLWPTKRNCQSMINAYSRREPNESFVVFEFDADLLLHDNYNNIKLSKYDSGSSPRFPSRCSYKKSLRMFLPLNQFGLVKNNLVPSKPSEIHEILVLNELSNISKYIKALYCRNITDVTKKWRKYTKNIVEFDGTFD